MPAKKNRPDPATLTGAQLVKETNRRIRAAMSLWDQHRNAACRGERAKALALYERLTDKEREQVPQNLRVWLRFRSEKYFGETRGGGNGAHEKVARRGKRKGGGLTPKPKDDGEDEWAGVGL